MSSTDLISLIFISFIAFSSFLTLVLAVPSSLLDLLTRLFYLVFLYLTLALTLWILDLYFLSLTLIIVYVGAIAILFLFIIMLCTPKQNTSIPSNSPWFQFLFTLLLWISFISIYLLYTPASHSSFNYYPDLSNLHTVFLLPDCSILLQSSSDIISVAFHFYITRPDILIFIALILFIVLITVV